LSIAGVGICSRAAPQQAAVNGVAQPRISAVKESLESRGFVGDEGCRACHASEFESYLGTRHHRTSQLPTKDSIEGHFDAGRNTMNSLDPAVSFQMDARTDAQGEGFFETALEGKPGREDADGADRAGFWIRAKGSDLCLLAWG
jgi:hypothetical protein